MWNVHLFVAFFPPVLHKRIHLSFWFAQLTASLTAWSVCCELQVCVTLAGGGLAGLTTLHTPFGWKFTAPATRCGTTGRLTPASLAGRAEAEAFNTGTETGWTAFFSCRPGAESDLLLELRLSRLFFCSGFLLEVSVAETDTGTGQDTLAEGCSFCLWFSCSALCRAASTSSLRSLKSCGQSSGGVGGGVLNSTTVGLIVPRPEPLEEPGMVVRLGGAFTLSCLSRPRVSICMRVWTPQSWPVKPDPTKQPAPVKIAVAVLPSMLRSNVGAGRMTEGRVAGTSGGVEWSGEAEPTDRLSDLLARREIVNWVGSFPSFLSRSGSSRRRALMNQLQIWNPEHEIQTFKFDWKWTKIHHHFRMFLNYTPLKHAWKFLAKKTWMFEWDSDFWWGRLNNWQANTGRFIKCRFVSPWRIRDTRANEENNYKYYKTCSNVKYIYIYIICPTSEVLVGWAKQA